MRHARWLLLCCVLSACGDDDGDRPRDDLDVTDAGKTDAGKTDAGKTDSGAADAGSTSSKLERFGLPRPPTQGLPAELRPPR